ncbi:hypothetical protein PAXRUDRAFT_90559, partial [Paxillus rubicundulus Ve08.2h10]
KTLISSLIEPYNEYLTETLGKPLSTHETVLSLGCMKNCLHKCMTITCLYFNYFASVTVLSCICFTLPQFIVCYGLFPTAPSQPQIAVSINLLAFY